MGGHDGRYVTGCIGTYASSTSPSNTLEWERIDRSTPRTTNRYLFRRSFTPGKFVANTLNMFAPSEGVFHLDGGTNWTQAGGPSISDPFSPSAIIYEEGRFMLSHWQSGLVYTSTDGVEWQAVTGLPGSGSGYHPSGVAYGEGQWVTVVDNAAPGCGSFLHQHHRLAHVPDAGEPEFTIGVAFGHGTFVVVGEGRSG
jgi:hypothetical protein